MLDLLQMLGPLPDSLVETDDGIWPLRNGTRIFAARRTSATR